MIKLTKDTARALELLRANYESTQTLPDGTCWGYVYLDNAIPNDWSRRKWAGHLANLTKHNLYRQVFDGHGSFGEVKLEA